MPKNGKKKTYTKEWLKDNCVAVTNPEFLGVKATTQNLIKQVLEGKRESYNGLTFKFLELIKDEMLEIIEKYKNKEEIDFNKYLK